MDSAGKWVTVGVVGRPHGVKGAVHVNTALSNPADLRRYSPFTLADGRELELESLKGAKEGHAIASFKTITTRDAAQALTHYHLRIARERLPELEGEDYYHADLIGLTAQKKSGEVLGKVVAVHNFGAGDVIEINVKGGNLMVAFSKAFVPEIDLAKNALTVSDDALIGE